jgi:cold shock CspA family protein
MTMSREYLFGQAQTPAKKRAGKLSKPAERRGVPDTGRIVKLSVGQGHGYIRLANNREIYFHRADVQEGTSINELGVGDTVTFERLDDPVSGDRALCVKRTARESS